MKSILEYVFIIFICISCTNQQQPELPDDLKNLNNVTIFPADTKLVSEIEFKEEVAFGDTPNVRLGTFTDIAVDSSGKVYIADSDQSDIKVYQSNGEFLKTLGREGKGPGEFTNIQNIQINDSSLYVYDNSNKRMVVFNIGSSEIEKTIKIATNKNDIPDLEEAYFSTFYLRNDGTFLISFYENSFPEGKKEWSKAIRTELYYIMDNEGQIVSDKLLEMKSGIRIFIPTGPITVDRETGLYGQALVSLADDNTIYSSWSDHFLIKTYNPRGKYQHGFYYPHKRIPLTEESAKEAGVPEQIINGMPNMDLPKYWPSIDRLLIDQENRLWISTLISDQSLREWYIVDKSGKLLAKFRCPAGKDIQVIKNNRVYTRERNKETGVQKIVCYKFNLSRMNS